MQIKTLGRSIVLLGVVLLNGEPFIAQADEVDIDTTLQRLQTNCYNENKAKFDEAKANLPPLAVEQIDLQSLTQDEAVVSVLESFGLSTEDLAGYQELYDEAQQYSIDAAKDAYRQLADINVQVAECYERELANEPTLLPQAQQILTDTRAQRQAIEDYDFSASPPNQADSEHILTVGAGETQTVRLRTFCIDGGLNIPDSGEMYYLAGDASQLQDSSVCDLVTAVQSDEDMTTTQNTIWESVNTELKPSSDIEPVVPPTTTIPLATSNEEAIIPIVAPALQPILPLAIALTVGGTILFLGLLIGGGLKWAALVSPASKVMLIGGVMLSAGVAGLGGWKIWRGIAAPTTAVTTQTVSESIAQDSAPADITDAVPVVDVPAEIIDQPVSLYEAQQRELVLVEATSPGTYTALDVTIHNFSEQTLELDTECLTFIPKVGPKNKSNTTDKNVDIDTTDDNDTADEDTDTDTTDEESSDNADVDPEHGSQRLMSDDIIDDLPPLPPDPPESEDTLDLDKLREKIEQRVRDAKKKYNENPSEDNLKDVLKETAKCMALGCSEENALDDVGDTWQKNVDQATKDYQADPSQENFDALKRATEIGQMLGSNTDAAVGALVGDGN